MNLNIYLVYHNIHVYNIRTYFFNITHLKKFILYGPIEISPGAGAGALALHRVVIKSTP